MITPTMDLWKESINELETALDYVRSDRTIEIEVFRMLLPIQTKLKILEDRLERPVVQQETE